MNMPGWPECPSTDVAYEAWQKARRAHRHLLELKDRNTQFFQSQFYSAVPASDGNTGHPTIRISVEPAPDDFPLIIGDVVHNLRAALDILWNTMLRRLGENDSSEYFPMRQERGDLESTLKGKFKLLTDAVPGLAEYLLDKVQLYGAGNYLVFDVNRLDRIDKHRLRIATINIVSFKSIRGEDEGNNVLLFTDVVANEGVSDIPSPSPWKVKAVTGVVSRAELAFNVIDASDLPVRIKGTPLLKTLDAYGFAVSSVISQLSELWRKAGKS